MSGKEHFQKLHDVMAELIGQLDAEESKVFVEKFQNKLEELRNEQAANLQEDIGAS
jgi:polyhydroxyalkanoate synthesis regulator phasin